MKSTILTKPSLLQSIQSQTASGSGNKLKKSKVLGFEVVNASVAETVYWIANQAQSRKPTQIAFLSAHNANVARKNWRYRDTLENVDALLPDGVGVALAAKIGGQQFDGSLNSSDLFGHLCRCLSFRRMPVFFLGGRPGVAKQAAQKTSTEIPNIKIAGHRHGFFNPREEDAVIDEINASGARVVFVSMGAPNQDVWIARVRYRLHAPVVIGVGALFDSISGRSPRAPLWMRKAGIEWLYRFKREPRRLRRSFFAGRLSFAIHAMASALSQHKKRMFCGLDAFMTRSLDVIGSAVGLILLAPLLLGVAAAIRLESPGTALFRQVRIGANGKPFEIVKFRSMRIDGPSQEELSALPDDRNDGVTFKLKKDPRITRLGRFIRKYSIDELPQLWNVLKGEMSLVGPRPALPVEVQKYSKVEMRRLCGKPGITGLWQIKGRANIPFDQQVVLDVAYLQKRSIWLDLVILARTPLAVLSARGAY